MASSDEPVTRDTPRDQHADAGRVADARAVLAAIDVGVFPARRRLTRAGQREALAEAVFALFPDA